MLIYENSKTITATANLNMTPMTEKEGKERIGGLHATVAAWIEESEWVVPMESGDESDAALTGLTTLWNGRLPCDATQRPAVKARGLADDDARGYIERVGWGGVK
ncbi:hypothetical protein PIB30_016463 [Stylosanthes scabra]|uniref:Uncharacterized protein n=1 Tax=Stylosanthes scabra TaxID=79078 RepID=A0ABU6X5N9_9FABA|nr:hypothetical protein [Stylosanthes scabra]